MKNHLVKVALLFSLILAYSCVNNMENNEHDQNHDHEIEHSESEPNHGNDEESQSAHEHSMRSITLIENGYELFMEYPDLVWRETAQLTIHITRLSNYKPIETNQIKLLFDGLNPFSFEAQKMVAGIYKANTKMEQSGIYNVILQFPDMGTSQQITIKKLLVYVSDTDIPIKDDHNESSILYLKEQAWNEEFGIYAVQKMPFSRIIKTSGEILPAPGDETIITALHSGTISLKNLLIEGKQVKAGEVIGVISSDLIHQNLTNDYLEAKNRYEKAKMDYERAQKLIDEKLISERDYLEARLNFESTKNNYNNIAKFYSDGNEHVKAPLNGFIRSVFVSEGQFITEGSPIATIIQNKKVVLKADIPQQYSLMASEIYEANFVPVYTKQMFKTSELNGKRISYSSALPANSLFTSINFELDAHPSIIPGSFCEVYLKSFSKNDAIVIPTTSLMEDQGNYFVFLMLDGEHYQKVFITIGNSDGEWVEVLDGISAGDVVVSKGTYQVYLASLGNSAPAHTHAH